jgi:hypothetical protein
MIIKRKLANSKISNLYVDELTAWLTANISHTIVLPKGITSLHLPGLQNGSWSESALDRVKWKVPDHHVLMQIVTYVCDEYVIVHLSYYRYDSIFSPSTTNVVYEVLVYIRDEFLAIQCQLAMS